MLTNRRRAQRFFQPWFNTKGQRGRFGGRHGALPKWIAEDVLQCTVKSGIIQRLITTGHGGALRDAENLPQPILRLVYCKFRGEVERWREPFGYGQTVLFIAGNFMAVTGNRYHDALCQFDDHPH